VFGADDFVALSEDLWISVKELNCMNAWRVLAAYQKKFKAKYPVVALPVI
jgi:hypothetical protein